MDSRDTFLQIIFKHYKNVADGKIPDELLNDLSEKLTDYYYGQYSRFNKQYPKSQKRYSSFQTKDLDHPTTFEIVIKFLKDKVGENYVPSAILLLNISETELKSFEKNREEFYKNF